MHRKENTLSTNPRLDRRLTIKLGLKLISVPGMVMTTHQDHAQYMEKHAVHVENKIISRASAKPKQEKGRLIRNSLTRNLNKKYTTHMKMMTVKLKVIWMINTSL
ncbi:hypothetical protein PoB_006772200 [Plakobranchus ocellatus]|uniref:Uncharacterized protein n=1 Tax=Plakobranchus ocellatus TaxID=259542 RepID=A0AAV4DAI3_9GAST|nr:hypothetical protein PoB_006772200 [Plakobranchus ocellatus]